MTKKRSKGTTTIFVVVPARVQDLVDIHRLHNDCFPEKERTLRWFMERLSTEPGSHVCYAAKVAGTDTVIGYLFAKILDNGLAELMYLGVSPMYRKRGVGKTLLAHFSEEAKGDIVVVYAYVPDSTDYLAAQLFLRECGFPESRLDRKKKAIKFQRSLI